MEKSKKLKRVLGGFILLTIVASILYAAEEPQQPQQNQRRQAGDQQGQRQRGGQRGGGFDRAEMQARMLDMMKDRMDATDEEWTIIKPRLEEVMTLSRNTSGMRGRGRGRGDRGRQQTEAPTEPVQIAAADLQKTLDKEAPTTTEIKAKLTALRGAREKNKQELVTAQQKLKEVLSIKQEALLVMMGMLE